MGTFTICGAGVVGKYMLSNVLIQSVGSLLIVKPPGSIQTNAHLGSKTEVKERNGNFRDANEDA